MRVLARALAAGAALLAASGTAAAAGAGETLLAGAVVLPAGAIPGADGGLVGGVPVQTRLSADGRYVAFVSEADVLSGDAHPDVTNVYRKDRLTGEVVFVSRAGGPDGAGPATDATDPTISSDGARVAWRTRASLVPADDDDGAEDVYVRDLAAATTALATPATEQDVLRYDLSDDAERVAFETAEPLLADDGNVESDVYLHDLQSGATTLVSWNADGMAAGAGASTAPSISGDGRWIAYASNAIDLVDGFVDGNGSSASFPDYPGSDVYVRDLDTGTQLLVSNHAGSATTSGDDASIRPVVTVVAGVPCVAYASAATDVAADGADDSAETSVYRRRLSEDASQLVSRANGAAGASADNDAWPTDVSADCGRVAFTSEASNLGGPHALAVRDVFVRDMATAATVVLAPDGDWSEEPAISADGAVVAWTTVWGAAAGGDPQLAGVYARAYPDGAPALVSRPPGGGPFAMSVAWGGGSAPGERALSRDGRWLAIDASSSFLPGEQGADQVYRLDLLTGSAEVASAASGPGGAPAPAPTYSWLPTISADGQRVAFASVASLAAEDPDDWSADVYVHDFRTGETILATPPGSLPGDDWSAVVDPRLSADGTHVVFTTTEDPPLVYERDLSRGITALVSRADGPAGAPAAWAGPASLSGDGRLVAFRGPPGLDPGAPSAEGVYVRDVVAGETRLVSRRPGLDGAPADGARDPVLSDDGRVLAFVTGDEAAAPGTGPWEATAQVVVRVLATGANALASRAGDGTAANADATSPALDGDGSVVAFASEATNLLPGRGGRDRPAVFARDLATGGLAGPPAFGLVGRVPRQGAEGPSLSASGDCLAFRGLGHTGANGPAGDTPTAYVHVLAGTCPPPAPTPPPPTETGGDGAASGTPATPRLERASVTSRRFRVGRRATARVAATRKPPVGTAFRFALSRATADVTIRIERKAAGRKRGGRCVRPTRALRAQPRCTRWQRAGSLLRHGVAPGTHRVAFSGRIGTRALKPGPYRATLVAKGAAGSSNRPRLTFTVVASAR